MRIAFLVSTFPVISETFILNQMTGLIDSGHDVDIYPFDIGDVNSVHTDVETYELMKHTFSRPAMPESKAIRVLKAASIFRGKGNTHRANLVRSLNVFRYGKRACSLGLLYSLEPWLGKTYDAIQCHFGPVGFTGAVIREILMPSCKLAVSFHGYDMTSYLREQSDQVYRPLFDRIDWALPISEHWRQKLISIGCPPGKAIVHHMGVDCNKFSFQPRFVRVGETVRIVTVARLARKKGLEYGIRAVGKLRDSFKNIQYTIVGDGPLKRELSDLITSIGAQDFVRLLGWKNQVEVAKILSKSHVFLYPSVTAPDGDQEGIPVGLMEAMAVGLPVVSTFHSGIPELVSNGESGFLAPERDVAALTEKLASLVQHPESWEEIGRAGRQQVESKFNIKRLNDRLVDIYRTL